MRRGVAVVAISADEVDESRRFAKEGRVGFPLLQDPGVQVANAYGVAMQDDDIAIPATFVISQTGHIHYKRVGETMADRPDLDEVLAIIDGLLSP